MKSVLLFKCISIFLLFIPACLLFSSGCHHLPLSLFFFFFSFVLTSVSSSPEPPSRCEHYSWSLLVYC